MLKGPLQSSFGRRILAALEGIVHGSLQGSSHVLPQQTVSGSMQGWDEMSLIFAHP